MTYSKINFTSFQTISIILFVGFSSTVLLNVLFLHHDLFFSDVASYWQDSLDWKTPFNRFHVPGYALVLAVVRGITFSTFAPVTYMLGINLIAFLLCAFLVYRIIQQNGGNDSIAAFGTLLFGLFPFVGLDFAVFPRADTTATLFFLTGIFLLQRSKRRTAALALGVSMITHKVFWIFSVALLISDFVLKKEYVTRKNFTSLLIMVLPLMTIWILGSFHYDSVTWIVDSNLSVELKSRDGIPVLHGLINTLSESDFKHIAKGTLLLFFMTITSIAIYINIKIKPNNFHYGNIILVSSLLLFVILNSHELWAAMRFNKLIVIPLAFIANKFGILRDFPWWRSKVTFVFFMICFLSQLFWSWYSAQ